MPTKSKLQAMPDERTREWWNQKMSSGYFTDFAYFFSYPNMQKFNLAGKQVLEIGFGYGRELSQFCCIGANAHGIDITDDAPKIAAEKLSSMGINPLPELKTYDGINIPYDNNTFDFIYSCFVIQHMSKVNARKLISEAVRVTKPGGTLLLEFFGVREWVSDDEHDVFSGDEINGMYNNAFTKDQVINMCKPFCENVSVEAWPLGENEYNHWAVLNKKEE